MTKKILAIIPARGGSKGLPGKNIIDLAGKPLIAWTIQASLQSKYINKTIVSSDNDGILSVAKKHGVETIKRPDELASDSANSKGVISHALSALTDDEFDYVVLLQPTSPLRGSDDIDQSFKTLFSQDCDSLISVNKTDNKILKSFKLNGSGYLEGISNNDYPFMCRQDLPETYISNGAIYIVKVAEFMKSRSFMSNKTTMFVMSKENSIDIDNLADLEKAKLALELQNY